MEEVVGRQHGNLQNKTLMERKGKAQRAQKKVEDQLDGKSRKTST